MPPLLGIDVAKGNHQLGVCKKLSQIQHNFISNSRKIDTVILAGRWSLSTSGSYGEQMKQYFLITKRDAPYSQSKSRQNFKEALSETIEAYISKGIQVVIPLQVPQQKYTPRNLFTYAKIHDLNIDEIRNILRIDRADHAKLQDYNRSIIYRLSKKHANVTLINPDDLFCFKDKCSMLMSYRRLLWISRKRPPGENDWLPQFHL